jgi:hypothetical protein
VREKLKFHEGQYTKIFLRSFRNGLLVQQEILLTVEKDDGKIKEKTLWTVLRYPVLKHPSSSNVQSDISRMRTGSVKGRSKEKQIRR